MEVTSISIVSNSPFSAVKGLNDPVPFNGQHIYVAKQVCFSEQRADLTVEVVLERSQWCVASCMVSEECLSSAKRCEAQREADSVICFPFQLLLKTLDFLTVS